MQYHEKLQCSSQVLVQRLGEDRMKVYKSPRRDIDIPKLDLLTLLFGGLRVDAGIVDHAKQ